jgi:hypothetical protein
MIPAARKYGKFAGMAGVYNETIMPRYIEMGRASSSSARMPLSWRLARHSEPASFGSSLG